MKRTAYRLLAISSTALMLGAAAEARTRPSYGGSLRVETRTWVSAHEGAPDVLSGLVFETLVNTDEQGKLVPGLASYWSTPDEGSRWEFLLRKSIQYHDGSPMTPMSVAESLARTQIPGCKLLAASNGVIVDCEQPQPNLPAFLAQAHYSIAGITKDGKATGTGPFVLDERTNDQFSLRANDDYWRGRPYLNSLQYSTLRRFREQITDFSLDRADVIEVGPEQLRRAQQDQLRLNTSRPAETILLSITASKNELRDVRLREAISKAIDRASIQGVIFQKQGELASSLLPNWLTGYAFLFPPAQDQPGARQILKEIGGTPSLIIDYEADDPVEKLIADRVALNASEVGLTMKAVPRSETGADIRIQRTTLTSANPAVALNGLLRRFDVTSAPDSASPEKLYAAERAALETYLLIPLVHLPRVTAIKSRIRNWSTLATGEWQFDDIWLAPTREVRP